MSININEEYHTEIVMITIKSTDYVLYWWPLPNAFPVPLASNLIGITKNRRF